MKADWSRLPPASLVLDVMNCLLLLMGGFSCLGVALPGYEQLFLF